MDETSVISAQDDQRVKRLFVSLISGLTGVNDQTYAGQDGYAVNQPRQYQTVGINGAVGIEGTNVSNRQSGMMTVSPVMLLVIGAGLLFFYAKD